MKTEKIEVILSNHDGDEIPAFVTFDVLEDQKRVHVSKVETKPIAYAELSDPEWDIREAVRENFLYKSEKEFEIVFDDGIWKGIEMTPEQVTIAELCEEIDLLIDRAEEGRLYYAELEHARKLIFSIRNPAKQKVVTDMTDLAMKALGFKNVDEL